MGKIGKHWTSVHPYAVSTLTSTRFLIPDSGCSVQGPGVGGSKAHRAGRVKFTKSKKPKRKIPQKMNQKISLSKFSTHLTYLK